MKNPPAGEANLESAIEHIAVAQRTDLLLVAPATADILAKFARGIADDFLTTLYLATTAPVIVAPAMNVNMWNHAATQENVEKLRARGVKIVNPDEGYLACGMTGAGRLAGQQEIVAAVRETLHAQQDLEGETILITAGPDVRRSRPGALSDQPLLRQNGLRGRRSGSAPWRQSFSREWSREFGNPCAVSSALTFEPPREMHIAVVDRFPQASIAIFAAAVADYRPLKRNAEKMKKSDAPLTISLEPTPDILAEAASKRRPIASSWDSRRRRTTSRIMQGRNWPQKMPILSWRMT